MATTACRELRSSDHFLPRLEGDARVAVAPATQKSWDDVVAGGCVKRNAQLFSGQRCDARLCLGSDGCRARRGMVAWPGEEEDEELAVVGPDLAVDNQTQSAAYFFPDQT